MEPQPDRSSAHVPPRRRGRTLVVVGVIVLLVAVAAVVVLRQGATPAQPAQAIATGSSAALPGAHADYVGGKACAECHAKAYAAWNGSHHDLAMQVADDKSVLGNFGNAKFTYAGVTSTFFKRDGAFFVNTDGPDGKLADFEIKYTFGVHPLQQYLIEFPGGRMQALSIAWDSRPKAGRRPALVPPLSRAEHQGRRSAALDRDRARTGTSCAPSATRPTCARTSTPRPATFKTTWSEIDVSCEACHGPGLDHVAWAKNEAGRQGATPPATGSRARARRAQGRDLVAGRRDRQRAAQRPAHERARNRDVRALPRPREPPLRRLRPRQAAARHAPARRCSTTACTGTTGRCATRSTTGARSCRARCTRRASPAPTATIRIRSRLRAPGNAVCAQCHQPAKYDAPAHTHHAKGTPGRIVCRLPHADDDVHGGRSAARPFAAHPAARPVGEARHAQRLQQLPREAVAAMGGRRDRRSGPGKTPVGFQNFAEALRAGIGRRAGRARRADRRSSTTRRSRRSCARAPSTASAAG